MKEIASYACHKSITLENSDYGHILNKQRSYIGQKLGDLFQHKFIGLIQKQNKQILELYLAWNSWTELKGPDQKKRLRTVVFQNKQKV